MTTSLTPVSSLSNINAQPPLDFSFEFDGKEYEIKFIKQRIRTDDGDSKEIDLKSLNQTEINQFKDEAIKVLEAVRDKMPDDWASMKSSSSFSLKFSQQPSTPSILNSTIGRVFQQYAYKKEPVILETIVHSGITISVAKKLQDNPENHEKISSALEPLHEHIQHVASRKKQPKIEKPQEQPTSTQDPIVEEVESDDEEPLTRPSGATAANTESPTVEEVDSDDENPLIRNHRTVESSDSVIKNSIQDNNNIERKESNPNTNFSLGIFHPHPAATDTAKKDSDEFVDVPL